ncbi:MAG: alpha/beta hydrolase [Candidatus Saccharimonadales bacterium]
MSQKSITVLYLPGLGGNYDAFRRLMLRLWPNKYNVQLVAMNWTDQGETFEQKKSRIQQVIAGADGTVVVIGESAGAAMGLILAHENPAVRFIAYCGKIGGAASTGDYYYKRIPAFHDMLPMADVIRNKITDAEKSQMMVVRAYKDLFLSERDNTIPGVKQIILPSLGHLTTIILGITILRYGLFYAIKRLAML